MNTIVVTGRLTRDPEIKYLDNGKAVASVSIADNQKIKGESVAIFFDCSIWGARAETFAEWCKKGDTVSIAGKLLPPHVKGDKAYLKVEVTDFSLPLGAKASGEAMPF